MTGKYYAILINSGPRAVPIEAVQAKLGTNDWLRLNINQFCVYSHLGAQQLWESVVPVLDREDLVLVVEIFPPNGWLSTSNPVISNWFAKARI